MVATLSGLAGEPALALIAALLALRDTVDVDSGLPSRLLRRSWWARRAI